MFPKLSNNLEQGLPPYLAIPTMSLVIFIYIHEALYGLPNFRSQKQMHKNHVLLMDKLLLNIPKPEHFGEASKISLLNHHIWGDEPAVWSL